MSLEWRGPCPVVRKLSGTTYEVRKERGTCVLHALMLERWKEPTAVCLQASAETLSLQMEHYDKGEVSDEPVLEETLMSEQKEEVKDLLAEFKDIMGPTPGLTSMTTMDIDTGDAQPIFMPFYRLAKGRHDNLHKELKQLFEDDIIEPSTSSWGFPVVVVAKKSGEWRMCSDYRALNKVTQATPFPMPRTDDLIDRLAGAGYITLLDMRKGYYQLPMIESARPKTAFVTPIGKFQFKTMPFGLKGAPAMFQESMTNLLADMVEYASAYLGDIAIFSQSWGQHLVHIRKVMDRLRKAGLTQPQKCPFGMTKCEYLGHMVGGGQVEPLEAKIKVIQDYTRPRTKKGLKTFLGLWGYYRKFVQDFSTIAYPLTQMTKNKEPGKLKWTAEAEQAFEQLKLALTSGTVLRAPDWCLPFYLQTDASQVGIGAVLSQFQDGVDRPIAYYSR